MAKAPGKTPPAPASVPKKAATDVVSRAVEASNAKVADLENSVQKAAAAKPAPAQAIKAARPLAGPPKPVAAIKPQEAAKRSATPPKAATAPGTVTAKPAVSPKPVPTPVSLEQPPAAPAVTPEPTGTVRTVATPAASAGHAPSAAAAIEATAVARPAAPAAEKSADTPLPAVASPEVAAVTAPRATDAVHASMASFADGVAAINSKTIEVLSANAGLTFDLFRSLIGATSVAEAVSIHAEHARHRFEVMSEQARELRVLAARVTADTALLPLRKSLG